MANHQDQMPKKSYFAHNNDATKILSIGNLSMKTLALPKKKKNQSKTQPIVDKKNLKENLAASLLM